jgi:hypothetical protein
MKVANLALYIKSVFKALYGKLSDGSLTLRVLSSNATCALCGIFHLGVRPEGN